MDKKNKMRVSQDHWRIILEFCEDHTEIITNKFTTHLQGKQNNKNLWEQLTLKLNSLGMGQRSTDEWKKTIADWKSKTKLKASKIFKHSQETGGGPACLTVLSSLEERLLCLMGKTATFGDNTVAEKGIKRKLSPDVPTGSCNQNLPVSSENIIIEEIVMPDHDYIVHDSVCTENVITENTTTPKNNTSSIVNGGKKIRRAPSTSLPNVANMHRDIVHILDRIENNIECIAKSLKDLVESIKQKI